MYERSRIMFSKNRQSVKRLLTSSTANFFEFTNRRNVTVRLSKRCISNCTLDGRTKDGDETRPSSSQSSPIIAAPATLARRRLLSPMRFADDDVGRGQRRRRYSSDATTATGDRANFVLESDFGPVSVPDTNLSQFVWKNVDKWGDKPMVTCGVTGKSYTFEKGREACTKFANAVVDELQLKKGDVIGLLLPNMPEYVIAIHGAIEAGVIVTFVNPLYTPEEIFRQFENARVKCCVTIPELLPLIEKIAPLLHNYYTSTVIVDKRRAKITDSKLKIFDFEQLLASQPAKRNVYKGDAARIDDLAVLPYSSGTTGLPKGVMLTHANLAVNLEQLTHPGLSDYHTPTDTFQEVSLSVLPFFHIYGLNIILNNNIRLGMHIITMPKFTPDGYLQCLAKYKPTQLFLVPSLLLFLATHPAVKPEYLKSVKEIVSGAAAATKSLIDNFKTKFNDCDMIIRQGYGMTELSPCVFLTPLDSKPGKDGAAGKLVRGTSARVVNLKTGENQPPYESGELYIKGPQIMKGYWNNEVATEEIIDRDGWLHTGDVAYYDEDGYFYIIDRTKELIKVKGNQVSPTELENIILKLPQVSDVAVIGVPDTLADEIPKAFVVLKPNAKLTVEEITNHVNSQVVNYKRLAGGIVVIDAIPRNAAGKILRKELKVLNGRIG